MIKSKPKVAKLNIGRSRNDDVSFVLVYAENDTPTPLDDKQVQILFEDLRTGANYLIKTPSQYDANKAIVSLTDVDKTQIRQDVTGISIRIEGVTVAKGNFTWSEEFSASSANPEAIGINYRTLDETVEWFEVMVGPTGKSAYQHAVDGGYTGTKEDFEQAMADLPHARDEAEAARDIAVQAKDDAVEARDEAVPAASTAVSAKEDALLAQAAAESARDIAVQAKNEAEAARDIAVPAASTAVSAKEDAEEAKEVAEEARDEAVEARDEAEYFAYLTGLGSPLWYGVEWDITVAATELTRIGNMDMHRELPIQNNRFGCVLKDDGTINYKLHPNNWAYQSNGEPSLRDGTDGQIGVFQEQYFARFETEGNIRRGKFSPFALPGFTRIPSYFRGAYEATVHRPTNKLSSVANNTADYRGGNNNAAWDGDDRSLLGVPASNISRTNFQAYARNRGVGWEMEPWWIYLSEWWLYLLEYSNRNCQLPFNATLTIDGFRQGGLGNGVTNLNLNSWISWKNTNPFIQCGYTDEMGVFSGEKPFEMPAGYGSPLTTYVPRWRGIENPFGHIGKWVDGINILIQSDSSGGKSYAYRSDNPANWSGSSNVDYRLIGEVARETGFITDVIFGEGGDLLPLETVGSAATFWADRWVTGIPSSGVALRGLRVGGTSNYGTIAGFGCIYSNSAPSSGDMFIGSRLCFLPEHPLLTS